MLHDAHAEYTPTVMADRLTVPGVFKVSTCYMLYVRSTLTTDFPIQAPIYLHTMQKTMGIVYQVGVQLYDHLL